MRQNPNYLARAVLLSLGLIAAGNIVAGSLTQPAIAGAAALETGGAAHNRRYVAPALTVAADVAPALVTLAHDPQTSGGLLAAIRAADFDDTVRALNAVGVQAWCVGRVEATNDPGVTLN